MPKTPALLLCAVIASGYGAAALADSTANEAFYGPLTAQARAQAERTLQTTLESKTSLSIGHWEYGETGSSGTIEPLRTFRIATGHYCREFRERVIRGGLLESRVSTACRNRAGRWVVVGGKDT